MTPAGRTTHAATISMLERYPSQMRLPSDGAFRDKPGFGLWHVVRAEGATIVFWRFEAGVQIPRHNHLHAQISIVLSGGIDMHYDDGTIHLGPGQSLSIEPHRWHAATLTHRSELVDVFVPNRTEYEEEYAASAAKT